MADIKITDYDSIPAVDRAADLLEIVDASGPTSYKVTPNALLGISGDPVGTSDSQTLTNKTITTPTLTVNDNVFTVQDNADTTKKLQLQLSGITTGNTRTLTIPDHDGTIATLTGTQTLTNKTLTSPTINTATISNPTLSVDSISEYTPATGVTIDGVLLKDGEMNGSYLTDETVDATKIDFGGSGSGIWWEEIGRTTLGSDGDTITVSSIPARRYLRIQVLLLNSSQLDITMRFNNSSSDYAYLERDVEAAEGGTERVSQTGIALDNNTTSANAYGTFELFNLASHPKMGSGFLISQGGSDASSAPDARYVDFKWVETSNQISRVDLINAGTGSFAAGSQVIVLGHD